MVIPKVGQDPVCYAEVILPQRTTEARPVQEGETKTTRTTRKRAVAEGESTPPPAPKRSPVSRPKAASAEVLVSDDQASDPIGSSHPATKSQRATAKTTKEVKTTRRTTSASSPTKKATTGRAKVAAKSSSKVVAKTKATK